MSKRPSYWLEFDEITTNEVANADVSEFVLAAAASELAWDAVLSSF